jgi:hypothetical protein
LSRKKKIVNKSGYPDEAIERMARCFYPSILEFYNSEEGQREFAAWKAEQTHARTAGKEQQDAPDGERPALHPVLFSILGLAVFQGAPTGAPYFYAPPCRGDLGLPSKYLLCGA